MKPIPFSKDCCAPSFGERCVTKTAYRDALMIFRQRGLKRSTRAIREYAIALLEQEIADTRKTMRKPRDQYTVRDCLWYLEPREKAVKALRATL
jgi:hypothetical protein